MSWREIGMENAKRENERLERQGLAHYSANLISNPIVEMHDTLKEIKLLLHEILQTLQNNTNGR